MKVYILTEIAEDNWAFPLCGYYLREEAEDVLKLIRMFQNKGDLCSEKAVEYELSKIIPGPMRYDDFYTYYEVEIK